MGKAFCMSSIKRALQYILGIGLLLYLIYRIGPSRIVDTMLSLNLVSLLFVFLLVYASLFCMALGLYYFAKPAFPLRLRDVYTDTVLTWAFTTFGPGRAGEFLLIYFFKQKGMPLGQASAIVVLDKIISIVLMAGLALLGLVLLVPQAPVFEWTLLTIVGLFGVILFLSSWGRRFIRTYILRRFSSLFSGFGKTLSLLLYEHTGAITLNFALTILKTVLTAGVYIVLFWGFGLSVDPLYTVLIFCVFTIAQGIPVTMNGLGIREGIGIWLYSYLGVDSSTTLAVFFTYFVFRNVFSVLSIMALAGERWRIIYHDIKSLPEFVRKASR